MGKIISLHINFPTKSQGNMKYITALLAALTAGSVSAFAPTAFTTSNTQLSMADGKCMPREEILKEPNTIEFGAVWDPLGLAKQGSDETIAWFRHAEVKHGRVAMAAFVGWWAVAAGVHFPGQLATGVDFGSLPTKGLDAWAAVPVWEKYKCLDLQLLLNLLMSTTTPTMEAHTT